MPVIPEPRIYECLVKVQDVWVHGRCVRRVDDAGGGWLVSLNYDDFPHGWAKSQLLKDYRSTMNSSIALPHEIQIITAEGDEHLHVLTNETIYV